MKRIKFLLILIVLQLMAPLEIFAQQQVPLGSTSGGSVTIEDAISTENRTVYFMRYPNGRELATEDKSIANNPEEALIYEGRTNDSGEIVLEDWSSEGQLRIVEDVPDGYSTSKREMNVDLSSNSTTSFTNYKGFINPNTGRTFVMIAIVAILLILITISITQRKHKTNALILLILPIISFVIAGMFQNVNAETKNFIITVKDNHGNKMPNVAIKIYAKPIVERDNSIKFSAGDGYFFDGTKEMYFRLPSQECTFEEFYNTLTAEQQQYLNMNWRLSYLDGFLRSNEILIGILLNENVIVSNGAVVTTTYRKTDIPNVVTIYGNGGYVDFFGKKLTEIHIYNDIEFETLGQLFTKEDSYNIGVDTNEKCGSYNQYGMKIQDQLATQKYYTCWNTKPDGIYINNQFFKGTDDTCYKESNIQWKDDNFDLHYSRNSFAFYNVTESRSNLSVSFLYPEPVSLLWIPVPLLSAPSVYGEPINSISIVENGHEILSISKEDIECTGTGKYMDEVESRCNIPTKHRKTLVEYLTNMNHSCASNHMQQQQQQLLPFTQMQQQQQVMPNGQLW